MEGKIIYFETNGPVNSENTLSLAKQRAEELEIKTILVASTSGTTAAKAMEILDGVE